MVTLPADTKLLRSRAAGRGCGSKTWTSRAKSASNTVWSTLNGGMSWRRLSPDLTRRDSVVPASVGKYATQVHDTAQGSITALALSPRDIKVLWAGTDDGVIQVTTDGGAKWTNVTPPSVKPWARI